MHSERPESASKKGAIADEGAHDHHISSRSQRRWVLDEVDAAQGGGRQARRFNHRKKGETSAPKASAT
jgi:hypothetical protein